MSAVSKEYVMPENSARTRRGRNIALFMVLAVLWLLLDILSKQYFTQAFAAGEVSRESLFGLFHFTLVHNTGAAWGIFGDSTEILAIISLVVSVLILTYFIVTSARATIGEVIGFALIIAGGVGNVIDRFVLGYVVDFIEFSFIDFPVFNVADIGVTCGFAILLISIIFSWAKEDKLRKKRDTTLHDAGIDSHG